jgi:protein-tyrosine phosphatase
VNDVYWIYGASPVPRAAAPPPVMPLVPVELAIVLCPRGGRPLHNEMLNLHRAGIDTLVSLLSEEQVEMLELEDEGPLARRVGMQFLHHPIPDHQLPPDPQAFRDFVEGLANRLRGGQRIGIHCWGSIGRATVTAACTLIHLGWSAADALAAVEAARGCPVPDTEEQQLWILDYKAQP